MGLDPATLSLISSVGKAAAGIAAVGGTIAGIDANRQQRKAQEKAKMIQGAQNRQQEMEEQRRRIREERIKRARVLQSSENTGVTGSSGELGALGSLATQLNTGEGFNLSAVNLGSQLTIANQEAADAANSAQNASIFSKMAPTAITLGASIFDNTAKDTDVLGDFIKQRRLD